MALERINLSVAEARDLAEGALRGIGFDDDEARIVCGGHANRRDETDLFDAVPDFGLGHPLLLHRAL